MRTRLFIKKLSLVNLCKDEPNLFQPFVLYPWNLEYPYDP